MKLFLSLLTSLILLTQCTATNADEQKKEVSDKKHEKITYPKENLTKAYFASGCFWCVEAVYESVIGVQEAISGYAGGHTDDPTYHKIGKGDTGHAETVEVIYDSTLVDFATLVQVFYGSQDPTTVQGQHPDYGSQYRSIIFYRNENEKEIAAAAKTKLDESGEYKSPIATEITAFTKFYPAEDYHQDYEKNHPNESYVRNVSIPRLNKFKAKFPELLKENSH